jgi:phosphoglycolate phosphatase-like HAD superfamily hydrolase
MLEVQDRYLRHLPQECATAPDYEVIEGVPELLKDLSELGMVSGLGTGNLERGARIKLERAGLNPYLPFGGFGSDSESRPDLLKAGRAKAEALSGRRFDPQEVFIIGDTERDILAAREAGFKVIAVATGNSPVDHLARFKPDHVIENFSRHDEFLEMICGN